MDKELLFKPRLEEREVELPDAGVVRVRGLSRTEVIAMRKATDALDRLDGSRALIIEQKMIALGMVDPELTEDEARQWQEAWPAGSLDPVTDAIAELSGLKTGQPKSDLPGDGGQPGAGV